MNNVLDAKTGVKDTLPTVLGYVGIGTTFGIIAHTNGFSPLETFIMSLLVYTASGEFALVSMLPAGSSLFSIFAATNLMSARMLLMTMTLAPKFKDEKLIKNLWLGSLVTDETFALAITKLNYTKGELNYEWLNAANLLAYAVWCLSSLFGALIGSVITDQSVKIELQLVMIGVTMVLTYLGLIFLPASVATIVVTVVGCLVGMVIKHVFFE